MYLISGHCDPSIWDQGVLDQLKRRAVSATPDAQRRNMAVAQRGEISTQTLSSFSKTQIRHIACLVHDTIPLFHPLETLVDSVEFQRLRRLHQVGVAYLVYPTAEHSRFSHSLGAYYLAYEFVSALRNGDPSLNITSEDMLCVSIAALLHDIGHGVFSHMFDNELLKEKNPNSTWTHEQGSMLLIDRLFNTPKIKEAFSPFLGAGERYARNIIFVKELVNPGKKIDDQHNWCLKGRDQTKSFLYDIVSNSEDGHDVDKFDYLIRDSHFAKVNITFGAATLSRLRNNMRVMMDEQKGYKRLAFALKVFNSLQAVGDSRQRMHCDVYQHYTVRSIERLIIRALLLADDYLTFPGKNGKRYKLSETINDMEAFLKTDDSVLSMIENHHSTSPEMQEARDILRRVHLREIPKLVDREDFSPQRMQPIIGIEYFDATTVAFKNFIRKEMMDAMKKCVPGLEVEVLLRNLNRGLDGKRHPSGEVLFFDNKDDDSGKCVARTIQPDKVTISAPIDPTIISLAVFAPPDATSSDRHNIKLVFDRMCYQYGLRSDPQYKAAALNGKYLF